MTWKHKLIAIAATLMALLIIGNAIRSHFQITKLERTVEQTKRSADEQTLRSEELEKHTYIYKEKIAYLEHKLAEIQAAAKQQDETLENLSADTDAARRDFNRVRRGSK